MQQDEHLRYPIGRFVPATNYTATDRREMLERFRSVPELILSVCQQIDGHSAWEAPYRPGGWTALQVVHHLADSHLNAYQRIKLTLTEDKPTLRPYDEQEWAILADNQLGYFVSQKLLASLHERLYHSLVELDELSWTRPCFHPSNSDISNLANLFATYDWHGQHHLGHLQLILNTIK